MISLQQTQLQIFEEFLQLETRVSLEFLPENFDDIEYFIAPDLYSPIVKDQTGLEFKQKRYKIIQEAKRTWLNIFLDAYEIQYQDCEHQCLEELHQFQLISSNNTQRNGITLFDSFLTYINYRTSRIKQQIYYEKTPIFRRKLLRLRRR